MPEIPTPGNEPRTPTNNVPSLLEQIIGHRQNIQELDIEILEPEPARTEHYFLCPECNEENDWLRAGIRTRGTDYGGYDVNRIIGKTEEEFDNIRIDFDDSGDNFEHDGERWWECRMCGHEVDYETIMENIHSRQVTPARRPRTRGASSGFISSRLHKENPATETKPTMLQPSVEKYQTLHGGNAQMRHKGEVLPDAFSPEVISEFQQKPDPYGYALTTPCPNCSHEFMIGTEDSNVVCPKCNHEFNIQPKRTPQEVGNAEGRRRRFGASFQYNEIPLHPRNN